MQYSKHKVTDITDTIYINPDAEAWFSYSQDMYVYTYDNFCIMSTGFRIFPSKTPTSNDDVPMYKGFPPSAVLRSYPVTTQYLYTVPMTVNDIHFRVVAGPETHTGFFIDRDGDLCFSPQAYSAYRDGYLSESEKGVLVILYCNYLIGE